MEGALGLDRAEEERVAAAARAGLETLSHAANKNAPLLWWHSPTDPIIPYANVARGEAVLRGSPLGRRDTAAEWLRGKTVMPDSADGFGWTGPLQKVEDGKGESSEQLTEGHFGHFAAIAADGPPGMVTGGQQGAKIQTVARHLAAFVAEWVR